MSRHAPRARWWPLAFAIALSSCIPMMMPPGMSPDAYQQEFIKRFRRASFTISGEHLLLRSEDKEPWQRLTITLDTDAGYFRQRTGDIEPGEVRDLELTRFVDESGKAFGPGIRLKSVWVQGHYPSDQPLNELAFPAATFGPAPSGESAQTPPR